MPGLQVMSESGLLKRVMLHRPGAEIEHLVPRQLGDMLFEDIPWARRMREEHDAFAAALRGEGVEVVYLEDCLRAVLADDKTAAGFAAEVLASEVGRDREEVRRIQELFLSSSPKLRSELAVTGIHPDQLSERRESLADHLPGETSALLYPLPNLYFTRDLAAVIGQGLALCSMNNLARRREATLMRLIAFNHPDFADAQVLYNNALYQMPLEGGDILVLSARAIAVGCSQRTNVHAVDYLARRLFSADSSYQSVLAIHIPASRAFMHLDTVMTMVDRDSFVVYPHVAEQMEAVEISRGSGDKLRYQRHDNIRAALKTVLELDDVRLILSGGGDARVAAREQWNDAANTLCVAPGRVIVYNRNDITNRCLRQNGIEIIEIEGSELVRGRGGPRCMSMPLLRLP